MVDRQSTEIQQTTNVTDYINNAPLGRTQVGIVILCALIAMLDGFDTQSIAFVAPTLAKQWSVVAGGFGPIFGAGLLGLMIGQLVFGPLADRRGRRPVILFCTMWFGVMTLGTAYANDWSSLLLLRFLTGIGLGGAMPNIIALTSEFSPDKLRSTLVTVMFGGFPLGAAIGGFISSKMIPAIGWQSVFYLGGIAPLVLLLPLYFFLPESAQHLTRKLQQSGVGRERLLALLNKLNPTRPLPADVKISFTEKQVKGASLLELFRHGLAIKTTLLWIAYFMSLLMIYFLMSWLPMILNEAGMPLDKAIIAAVALNLGGMAGGVLLGLLLDRFNPYTVLASGYFAAGICILCIGLTNNLPLVLMAVVFAAGFTVIGAQTAMNAVTASIYPSRVRASGLGAALAVGRIGSIIGPVTGGMLIAMAWPISGMFAIGASPAIIACLAILGLKRVAATED